MRPITRRQLRVLHREFLFRIVDRELLSSHARGDMSKLLLQIISLLIFVGILSASPAVLIKPPADPVARMLFGWTYIHALITTTMLVVGLFGVLSWNSMFPDRLDVHVLAPLPVRARTVLVAKIIAVSTGLGATVLALHAASGLIWPLWLNSFTPIGGSGLGSGALGFVRVLAAYWITMIAAAVFVFGTITSVQGSIAYLLPRRYFLRVSSFLQLATFALIILVYVIQPTRISPTVLAALEQQGPIAWLPSFWFFGLFHQISGSAPLAPLAVRASWAVALVALLTAIAYGLSYARMLRRIAEEAAIAPGGRRLSWLPAFGTALQTAVTQFSIRTLLRSPQHRLILAFYLGIGGTVGIMLLGVRLAARGAQDVGQRLTALVIFSNIILLIFALLGTRVAFGLPLDLRANWIFRVTPVPGGRACLAARRRALLALSAGPVWIASAVPVLSMWPWWTAAAHLAIVALLSLVLVEIGVFGSQKVPFTCSYLPGKSNVHATFWVGMLFVLIAVRLFAEFERTALQRLDRYAMLVGSLTLAWMALRRWSGSLVASDAELAQPEFEELEQQPVALNVWDSRFAR